MTHELALSMEHASKRYGHQLVLDNVSLNVKKGTILGLIGPSGAGKSTTIKCLMGMEKLDNGNAYALDKQMPNREILQKIGYMGQNDALYENLSAEENLIFFGSLMNSRKSALKDAIKKNLTLVKLEDFSKTLVKHFSGGMKRRLSLAITLLAQPELIILDEPTVGIDPSLRVEIWKQLRYLATKGNSIVVTTHVMDEAERCDEVGLIIGGKVFALNTPEHLMKQFQVTTIEEVFLKAEVKENDPL